MMVGGIYVATDRGMSRASLVVRWVDVPNESNLALDPDLVQCSDGSPSVSTFYWNFGDGVDVLLL